MPPPSVQAPNSERILHMKTPRTLTLALAFLAGCSMSLAVSVFPTTASDKTLPLSAAASIDFLDATPDLCAVGCSGHMLLHRDPATTGAPPHFVPIELVELSLTGAGVHLVPQPQPFKITLVPPLTGINGGKIRGGATNDFPTAGGGNSFFDVFFEVQVNGMTLFNPNPAHLVQPGQFATPAHLASFFDIFVCAQPVPLNDKANPGTQVATMASLWMRVCKIGNEAKHGVSIDIRGQSTLGRMDYTICMVGASEAAVIDIKPEKLLGDVTSNLDCDEVFRDLGITVPAGGVLKFEAIWDRNVRVGDWRGFHKGKFRIFYEVPALPKPKIIAVASGKLNGTHGVGTHRLPLPAPHDGEDCEECSHYEGALIGAVIVAGKYKGKLEATYAGVYLKAAVDEPQGCCPAPPIPPSGRFIMTLDGVAVTRCLAHP